MDKIKIDKLLQIVNKSKLLYIDSSKYAPEWHSTLHSHPFTELFYVVSGEGEFQFFDGTSIDVKQDDLLFINPNVVHTEVSHDHNPLEYIVLGIDGVGFIETENFESDYSIYNYEDNKHEILFYLKTLYRESNEPDHYKELLLDNLLNVLLINIVRRSELNLNIEEERKSNKDCLFIENYLNTHYNENITLEKLSDLTFINKFYLSHIFKEHSGHSPIEYLLMRRVEAAMRLLTTTDHSISQIAGIVGFGTSSYFSQYFKRETGQSPSAYREKYKNHTDIISSNT